MYKLAVIVVDRYSCELIGLTVQDYIDDYWLIGITKTVRISWLYRINKPKSIEPVRESVGFVKRHANRRRTCYKYMARDHLADMFTTTNNWRVITIYYIN